MSEGNRKTDTEVTISAASLEANEYLKPTLNRYGEVTRVDFSPSAEQLRFAIERANVKNSKLSDNEVMKLIGLPSSKLTKWRKNLNPHFEAWLCKQIENFSSDVRKALFAFGVNKALQGDYNFWKSVAQTVGAISGEKVTIENKVESIEGLAKLGPEALAKEEARILAELTGTSGAIETDSMVESSEGEEPESCTT